MKYAVLAAAAALVGVAPAYAANVIDQNAPANNAYMAGFYQSDLAQSFKQDASNISGAGIFLTSGVSGGNADITIALWDNLPTLSGTQLASGTVSVSSNNQWVDVFWSPVSISSGSTYYLVFTSTDPNYGIAGDTLNGYADGQVYANSGFYGFPSYDYTFRTYADDAFTPGVPEASTWAMMIAGMGLVGTAMRRRRTAVSFA